jgi:hypothetical protein
VRRRTRGAEWKLEDTLCSSHLAQIQLGGTEPQTETTAEVLDLGEKTALEGVLKSEVEKTFDKIGGISSPICRGVG